MDPKTREQMLQIVEQKAAPQPVRGLGDVVAKVTKAVGIKPCGPCERRRQMLNQRFPFKK
jgi:hypothetical protein